MKKSLIIIAIIVVVFVVAVLLIGRTYYPDNIAETAPDGGAKNLKTRFYKTDLATAAAAADGIVPTLSSWGSNWKLSDQKNEGSSAVLKAEVPVVIFTDDLEINMTGGENGVTVNVRSNSRVGKSDFGENRRHVVQFLEALDKKLGNSG